MARIAQHRMTWMRMLLALAMAAALFVQTGASITLYACGMSGEVSPSCCCDPEEGEIVVTATSDGCCDLVVIGADDADAPVDTVLSAVPVAAISATGVVTWPQAPQVVQRGTATPPRGPPRSPGVPPYIENCSFLI